MQSLATAVVQVYMAVPTDRDRWTKQHVGVATLSKDNGKRTYFLRVVDLLVKFVNCFILLDNQTYCFHLFTSMIKVIILISFALSAIN